MHEIRVLLADRLGAEIWCSFCHSTQPPIPLFYFLFLRVLTVSSHWYGILCEVTFLCTWHFAKAMVLVMTRYCQLRTTRRLQSISQREKERKRIHCTESTPDRKNDEIMEALAKA